MAYGQRFGDRPGRLRLYVLLAAATAAAGLGLGALSYQQDLGWTVVPATLTAIGLSGLLTTPLMRRSVPPHNIWGPVTALVSMVVAAVVFFTGPWLQRVVDGSPERLAVAATRVWTTGSGDTVRVHSTDGQSYRRLTLDGTPGPAVRLDQRAPSVTDDGERLLLHVDGGGPAYGYPSAQARTTVYDAGTGRELFAVDGSGVAAAGDTLVLRTCPAPQRCTLTGVDRTSGAQRWTRTEAGQIHTTWESDPRAGLAPDDGWPRVLPGYAVEAVDGPSGRIDQDTVRVVAPASGAPTLVPGSRGVIWAVAGRQRLLVWKDGSVGTLVDPRRPTDPGVEVTKGPEHLAPRLYGRTLVARTDLPQEAFHVTTGGSWFDPGDPFPDDDRSIITDGTWWITWDEATSTVRARNIHTAVGWEKRLDRVAGTPYLKGAVADGTVVLSYLTTSPLGMARNSRVLVLDARTGAERGRALVPLTFSPGIPLPGGHGWAVVNPVTDDAWVAKVR